MKPFDLQKALAGEPVVTRDGDPVTGLHLFEGTDATHPLAGVLKRNLAFWGKDGTYHSSPATYDLFTAPQKRVGWANIYSHGNNTVDAHATGGSK